MVMSLGIAIVAIVKADPRSGLFGCGRLDIHADWHRLLRGLVDVL